MATNQPNAFGGGVPADPEDLLPEESVLSLDDYLAVHAAVGHRNPVRDSLPTRPP